MMADTIDLLIILMSLSNDSYHISRLCMKDAIADGFPAVRDLNKLSACLFNASADIRNDVFYFLIAGAVMILRSAIFPPISPME